MMTMNSRSLLTAGCLVVLILGFRFGAADDDLKTQPSNLIDFPYLTDPNTISASVKWDGSLKDYGGFLLENRKKQRRIDLSYQIDGLIPLVYHPDGIFRADIDGAFNWVIESGGVEGLFETDAGTSIGITQGKPYFGSLAINGSCEASADSATEKWMMRNYLVGLKLRQMIPGSDIDIIGKVIGSSDGPRLSGNVPIVVELSGNRVFQRNPEDTSYYRVDLVVDWGIQLIEQIYLYPHFEVTQTDNAEAQSYFVGEIAKYFKLGEQSASMLGLKTEFVFLARYVTGKRPPNYIQIDDWEIGFGVDLSEALSTD